MLRGKSEGLRDGAPKCLGCKVERPEGMAVLWAVTDLGPTAVNVHRHRPCAEAARKVLGNITTGDVDFVPAPPDVPARLRAEKT